MSADSVRLVLFDIDGTILTLRGTGNESMVRAIERVFGRTPDLAGYSMSGKTDPQIFLDLLARVDISADEGRARFDELADVYVEELGSRVGASDAYVYPGVAEVIERLGKRADVLLGLLTGNLERGAWIKLRHVGLDSWFRLGGFGDGAEMRSEIPPRVLSRAQQMDDRPLSGNQTVVIGDTPADIHCARPLGVRTVAVATGRFAVEDLLVHEPHAVLPDMADTERAIDAILGPLPARNDATPITAEDPS